MNLWQRCFATLIFRDDNLTVMRRPFEEDEFMVRLWVKNMLNITTLPVFVMHTNSALTDAQQLLREVDPNRRVHYWQVNIVHGGYWSVWPWYRMVHTKLNVWALPCKQVAFLDYDGLPLRNLDGVFDECPKTESLCACQDHVTPKKKGLRLPNAGLLVVRRNISLHEHLVQEAENETQRGVVRFQAEQGFLNSHFPSWHGLPAGYNLPQSTLRNYLSGKQHILGNATGTVLSFLEQSDAFYLHMKLRDVPRLLAEALGFTDEWDGLHNLTIICDRRLNASGVVYDQMIRKRVVTMHGHERTANGSLRCYPWDRHSSDQVLSDVRQS